MSLSKDLREQYKTFLDRDDLKVVSMVIMQDDGNLMVVTCGPAGTDPKMLLASGLKSLEKQLAESVARVIDDPERVVH